MTLLSTTRGVVVPDCAVNNCVNPAKTRAWCVAHYQRWLRHGDPLGGGNPHVIQPSGSAMPGDPCTIEGCSDVALSLGWCQAHYTRSRKHGGDPLGGRHPWRLKDPSEYFLKHISDVTDDCMIWPFAKNGNGEYGSVYLDGVQRRVHVAACEWRWGPMPSLGMHAAHGYEKRCVSTLCWNPAHLSWKPPKGNTADRYRDGTVFYGEEHPASKATETMVRDIRTRYAAGGISQRVLAAEYGLDRSTVGQIIKRKTWKHVL